MFIRICHHSYSRQGLALDDTSFENHGKSYDTVYEPDGVAVASGASHFGDPTSRIRIATNPSWSSLRALRITAQVRLDALNPTRSNLVEGHLSFAFFVTSGGVLTATVLGPEVVGGPKVWHGVSSAPPYAPDSRLHTVPVGRWVTLGLEHDGFAGMRVSIDGQVVGERRDLIAPVASVGALGVHIGNWPDANAYALMGSIDDLVIEKYDPDALGKEVLLRPWRGTDADCWAFLLQAIEDAIDAGDETALDLLAVIGWIRDNVLRQLLSQDASVVQQNEDFALKFLDLWSSGGMASDEMAQLLADWFCWLKLYAGVDLGALAASMSSPTLSERPRRPGLQFGSLQERVGERECDPELLQFLKLIESALEGLKDCVSPTEEQRER